ncbi:biotin--[acetyl-CoA-carboxylase] ligase [Selenomonas sp. oral taxon 138]|uniref:biotin--[acetyl-CoA-carboxylase] ligase n=1 Tax=Selenomonas sp. oral taxon 138 TaxID=712532 RepID=UPI0002A2B822|nr:biotin--[acetyl-CoA-carboxylase] ligase [Selenomonas sp. oral taxon 138]EKX94983.1 biotin--[acetyl-CoA-carboxylase] ligase [Selenomonas sp. oral taxon 138 str. F0429]
MSRDVLELLRAAGGYISGEKMAERLGVTRAAVWKKIAALRDAGYDISSAPRSGYVLRSAPDRLIETEISQDLKTALVGRKVICYDVVDSTNLVLKNLAREGAEDGTVVVADSQGTGRGRMERAFFSPPGKGIWVSILLRPTFLPQDAPKCTLMAAVAVARAMEKFGLRAAIKWPNDILHDGRKLVGILTEMSAEMDCVNYVVIGIGINVNIAPEEFPAELRAIATSLMQMKGAPLPRVAFLQELLRVLDDLYASVQREGFAPVLAAWREYAVTLGQEVRVIGPAGEEFEGVAVDIDAEGALLVDTAEGRRRVLAGDVSIRPRA